MTDLEAYLDQKLNKTARMMRFCTGLSEMCYFDQGNLERAASAYEASLVLNPDNADALNNLAWLLATSPSPTELRDPQRALSLALESRHALKKAPHISGILWRKAIVPSAAKVK